jgi:hypothetical protein
MNELDEEVAKKIFGWRWMSWVGIPVKGTPGYPARCRIRQFMSPDTMRNQRWLDFWNRSDVGEVREATGDEPLSYCYCSSQGCEIPPDYSGADDIVVLSWARQTWPKNSPEWQAFSSAFGLACDYNPGDYSRAALAVQKNLRR